MMIKILYRISIVGEKILDTVIWTAIIAALLYGSFSIWQDISLSQEASSGNYSGYSPVSDDTDGMSFDELKEANSEVIGWISIDGTSIDYPLTQAEDNSKYVNVDAFGDFSMAGNPFLDYRNSSSLSDPYNITYGHHMAGGQMFGALDGFQDQKYLEEHSNGTLYSKTSAYDVKWFACVKTDAYDGTFFTPLKEEDGLKGLLSRAWEKRASWTGLPPDGSCVIALSTCFDNETDGRLILLGSYYYMEDSNA